MTAQKLKISHGRWYYFVFRMIQFTLRGIFHLLYRTEVYGLEKVPRIGRILLCSNHISYVDPVIIAAYIPRYTYFMAKKELFRLSFLSNLVTFLNTFPVRRDTTDRYAFDTSIKILEEENLLGLFPEGTRSVDGIIREGKKGIGLISLLSGSDILPVAISGTNRIIQKPHKRIFFPKIKMIVGDVIKTDRIISENEKKQAISIIVSETMKSIKVLYEKISQD
jgi:1-acyl-sn-glycerol-3-phosphate acyltransferase